MRISDSFKTYRFLIMIPWLIYSSIIFFLPTLALSWGPAAHVSMTNDAFSLLSKIPNATFDKKYLNELVLNVLEPDQNRVINHTDIYECGSMINDLANRAERLLHKNEDWAKIMFIISQATHYIEDLNNPQHCIKYEKGYHEEFERIVTFGFWTQADFDGFHYIKNYKIFAENACQFSRRYLNFTYKLSQNYDSDLYKKVVSPLWNHTVNDVLDLWLTILWNGLGERDFKAFGLQEPKGIRDDKKVRSERIKDLQ